VRAATPGKVLAALAGAGEVVIHAHGLVECRTARASFLALSPDIDGTFALTTAVFARPSSPPARSSCSRRVGRRARRRSGTPPWSLPAAFVYAGARAVIASTAPIPDGRRERVLRRCARAGARRRGAAVALRDARQQWLAQGRARLGARRHCV